MPPDPPPGPLSFPPQLLEWVRPWSADVDIRCGALPPPPDPPFTASLYPFTTLTKLDFEGYPNWRDKRLEFNLSLGPQGWYVGYEDGEHVAARTFTTGRKLRWDLAMQVLCATHADTFIELVAEPGPRIGVYGGPNRMRCLTGALGTTWSGYRDATAFVEVEALTAIDFVASGRIDIALGPGQVLSRDFTAALSASSYDARRNATLWQLRWRIDRLANLDVYDGTYQVAAPDGEPLERGIVVRHASFSGI
jgi:hypothetical protein